MTGGFPVGYSQGMTSHAGHGHDATPGARNLCRKLRLADRPFVTNHTVMSGYLIQAFDASGRILDMDATPEGDMFLVDNTSAVVWVLRNLRYGIRHDWDADTHTLTGIRTIKVWHTTGGMGEIHTVTADGSCTMTGNAPRI